MTSEGDSPASLVIRAVSPDDAGAQTASRYEWQTAMAAADGLALFRSAIDASGRFVDSPGAGILCEHLQDWCVLTADDAELVSAKHRDDSVGPYRTLNELVTVGGLRQLFERWRTLDETPTCRLVTNTGLAAGEAARFTDALPVFRAKSRVDSDPLPGRLAPLLGVNAGEVDVVARFLARLHLDHSERPSRQHTPFAAPAMYVAPVIAALGIDATQAPAVWEAILGLFRARMQAAGPLDIGALPPVARDAQDRNTQHSRDIARRMVTLIDIHTAIQTAVAHPLAYISLRPLTRTSRNAIKMSAGHCSENTVERAEQLRLDYQRYWRDRRGGDPAARIEEERLRRRLLRISDHARAALGARTDQWGADFWIEIEREIDGIRSDDLPALMDGELALGGICDLANRCRVWFSEQFDCDAVQADLRARARRAR